MIQRKVYKNAGVIHICWKGRVYTPVTCAESYVSGSSVWAIETADRSQIRVQSEDRAWDIWEATDPHWRKKKSAKKRVSKQPKKKTPSKGARLKEAAKDGYARIEKVAPSWASGTLCAGFYNWLRDVQGSRSIVLFEGWVDSSDPVAQSAVRTLGQQLTQLYKDF